MDVCSNGRARLAGLCVVWIVASCGLYACGDEDSGSSVDTNAAPDLSDIPISPSIDELPEGTTALVGRVFDYTNDAPIVDAVVTSTPPSETVRTNSRGEFVLTAGLVDRQVYTIGATEPRYVSETIEMRALSEVIREADMYLFPDGVASLLTPVPAGVELSANQRRAVVFLTSPSDRRVGVGVCPGAAGTHTGPDWLKVNVPEGVFYRNNPGAVELLVDGEAFAAASAGLEFDAQGFTTVDVDMCDTDDANKPITITAQVQRYEEAQLGVCVVGGAGCEDNTSTDRILIVPSPGGAEGTQRFVIDLQPQHDRAPILGEAVDCEIGEEGSELLPATVRTTSVSDNTGVARCEVELALGDVPPGTTVRGQARLTAYNGVTVDFELQVSP